MDYRARLFFFNWISTSTDAQTRRNLIDNFGNKKNTNQKFNSILISLNSTFSIYCGQKSKIAVQNSLLKQSRKFHYFIRFLKLVKHTLNQDRKYII